MLRLRSLAFNVAFYAWTTGLTLATLPFYFFVSQEQVHGRRAPVDARRRSGCCA